VRALSKPRWHCSGAPGHLLRLDRPWRVRGVWESKRKREIRVRGGRVGEGVKSAREVDEGIKIKNT
jgi:hypothetical protein